MYAPNNQDSIYEINNQDQQLSIIESILQLIGKCL